VSATSKRTIVASKRLHGDRGSALVEFVLVLPVFLLVVLGSLTFLWLLAARSAVTGAARDGARYASIRHDWMDCPASGPCNTDYPSSTEVSNYVKGRAGAFSGGMTVSVTPTSVAYRNQVITVTASRDLPNILGTFAGLFGVDHITYSSSAVARSE